MALQFFTKGLKGQPRSKIIARSIVVTSFAALTIMAVVDENVIFAPLFFLFCLYYLRKLLSAKGQMQKETGKSSQPLSNPAEAKEDLINMLKYYKQLLKNWKWIAAFGWVLSVGLLIYAQSVAVILPVSLACYSTYALIRCRQAVQLIEASPTLQKEGRLLKN